MSERRIEEYRREFPISSRYVYLDHAGVAPISLRVRRAVEEYLISAGEEAAFQQSKWTKEVEKARGLCARLLSAETDEVAFIRSTSHGLSLVAAGLDWRVGDNVVTTGGEFPSNRFPWVDLSRLGVEVRFVSGDTEGRFLPADVEAQIDGRTRVVTVSSVQFASGFHADLEEIGEICQRKEVFFCVDAIQSLGVIPMDVKKARIDFLAADGHKWLLGPEGTGVFYCRRGLADRLHPALVGWKSVKKAFEFERPIYELKDDALRFEEGSQNIIGIVGLGAAISLLMEVGLQNIRERIQGLGDMIIRQAECRGLRVITPRSRKERGGAITFSGGFEAEKLRERLKQEKIMANARCGGLRVSPHFYNTEDEILHFFAVFDSLLRMP
jgi:cysteine desulfurase/selenocysteine lyase